jgi:hypothetical protein
MKLRVECYSGRKNDERPIRFQLNGHEYTVEEVLDQWYSPDATFFKVRTGEGHLYVLRHSTSPQEDCWRLESYRRH